MLKKLICFLAVSAAFIHAPAFAEEASKPKILISKVVEHPALDSTTQGIVDTLKKAGYESGKNMEIRVESAQANPALAQQIANKFVNMKPEIVVGVGTLSAQSFAKYAAEKKVKLIFSSVTDPLAASLVESLQQPGKNTAGVSNFVALEPQLQLFKQLLPKMKKIGILYNSGEINSVSIAEKLRQIAPQFDLVLVEQTVNKTAEVAQNAVKLASQVDAIFISNDNTALSALTSIVKAADKKKIPVFVSDADAVKLGAVAALGPNQYEIGQQTGEMILRVLKGQDIATQTVEFPKHNELTLNTDAAAKLEIVIPEEILKKAVSK